MFIDDTTLIHFKDGKPVLYEVDPELAKALNASDRASISDLVKMLALPANVLRTGAILNPAFMERNFQRSQSKIGKRLNQLYYLMRNH